MSKREKSWGWHIREFNDSHHKWVAEVFGDPSKSWLQGMVSCRKKNCEKRAEVYVCYRYITGQRGRVSANEKPYCREHAEQIIAQKTKKEPEEDGEAYDRFYPAQS